MNLAQLDLNLLVALDALLREQNVTRAGQRIGLSQPAMSSALNRLRHLFEDELLVRVGRTYYLTPLAMELSEPLQDVLQLIEKTVERRPAFNPATDDRTFRVATSDYAALIVLDRLLPRLGVEAPRLTLRTIPTGTATFGQLETGEIDLAFMPQQGETRLPHTVLFVDRWVCAVSEDNLDVGEAITLQQFVELPQLVFRPGEGEHSFADRVLETMGIARRVQIVVNSFLLLPFLVHQTPYVTLIYERVAQRLAKAARVRLLEPPVAIPEMPLAMYWPAQRSADPAHLWLREQIIACCRDLE